VVNGDLIGPASQDAFLDPDTVRAVDPGLIGPLGLREGVLDLLARVLPVMPGRARNPCEGEGLPLGTREAC
jgi:hypothetical protein